MTITRFPTISKEAIKMKVLKFLFTARMSFILFALLAFVATMLYLGWVRQHQTPALIRQTGPAQTR